MAFILIRQTERTEQYDTEIFNQWLEAETDPWTDFLLLRAYTTRHSVVHGVRVANRKIQILFCLLCLHCFLCFCLLYFFFTKSWMFPNLVDGVFTLAVLLDMIQSAMGVVISIFFHCYCMRKLFEYCNLRTSNQSVNVRRLSENFTLIYESATVQKHNYRHDSCL